MVDEELAVEVTLEETPDEAVIEEAEEAVEDESSEEVTEEELVVAVLEKLIVDGELDDEESTLDEADDVDANVMDTLLLVELAPVPGA